MDFGEFLAWIWWLLLFMISLFNVTYCWINFGQLCRKSNKITSALTKLSFIFVHVCAYRAIFPRQYSMRTCFFNHWLNWPLLGRFMAMIAELCITKQVSLVLQIITIDVKKLCYLMNKKYPILDVIYYLSNYMVPLICVAQCCCWIGVSTKNEIWNMYEEIIWAIESTFTAVAYIILYFILSGYRTVWNHKQQKIEKLINFIIKCIVFGVCYSTFLIVIDIPMYHYRHQTNNIEYDNFLTGIINLSQCINISKSYDIWYQEAPWMTAYFSLAVWMSMYCINGFPRIFE